MNSPCRPESNQNLPTSSKIMVTSSHNNSMSTKIISSRTNSTLLSRKKTTTRWTKPHLSALSVRTWVRQKVLQPAWFRQRRPLFSRRVKTCSKTVNSPSNLLWSTSASKPSRNWVWLPQLQPQQQRRQQQQHVTIRRRRWLSRRNQAIIKSRTRITRCRSYNATTRSSKTSLLLLSIN